ncbi:hypothetical protein NDA18_005409 [Ustilago nuda]|nr:hypothetical protein NDA18_005409 [Ustilago nuda]
MDVSVSASTMPIVKGSTDYHSWQKCFKRYIEGINPIMWDHITDTVIPILSIKDEKLRHLHLTASRKVVSAILDAVAPDVAVSIDDDEETSAHQIWKLLEDRYSKGTVIQPYILLTELVQCHGSESAGSRKAVGSYEGSTGLGDS